MALSLAFREMLDAYGGEWDHHISASRAWVLTFFSNGPPPVAVAYLQGKRETTFFEELVKLSDVKKVWDARALIVTKYGSIDTDGVQLATNSGVYVVFDGDKVNLEAALSGADVSEVNRATQVFLLSKRSRSASKECRDLAIEVLPKKWMTLRELEEQLQWRFDGRTVKAQVRSLQREGKLCVRGRTCSGEGLLGTPDGRYRMRLDLSAPTKRMLLSGEVIHIVKVGTKPVRYRDISEKLGIKAHEATAVLRKLAREGTVEKKGEGWILKAQKEKVADKGRENVNNL